MTWYLLLGAATLGFAIASVIVTVRARSLGFAVGLLLIYYFSLLGGWVIVLENRGFDVDAAGWTYGYLYGKLFSVRLDADYRATLALYAVFVLTICGVLLMRVRPIAAPLEDAPPPLPLSHGRLLVTCGLAASLTLAFSMAKIVEALASGASAYVVSRTAENDPSFAIGAVLSRAAIIPAAIGFAVYCSNRDGRYMAAPLQRPWHGAGYVAVLGAMYALSAALGNKHELLTGTITAALFYLANAAHPRYGRLAVLGLGAVLAIGTVEILRSAPLALIGQTLDRRSLTLIATAPLVSNEVFGAHFSMYGALHERLPLTWGTSVIAFILSIIPRLMWPDRPADIYAHYAMGVGATEGQGYTIHHATGWYLNFGVPGLLIGATLLGLVWSALHNRLVADRLQGLLGRTLTVVAPWTFIASLPSLMRSGPEGYKGVAINAILVPVIVMALASATFRFRPASADDVVNGDGDARDVVTPPSPGPLPTPSSQT